MALSYDDRRVLDEICDAIGEKIAPLCIRWSVGMRKDVEDFIAAKLNYPSVVVSSYVSEFIRDGLLTDDPKLFPICSDPNEPRLGITHEGWQRWSYFSGAYFCNWDCENLDEWLAWDGDDEISPIFRYQEAFQEIPVKPKRERTMRYLDDPWEVSQDQ